MSDDTQGDRDEFDLPFEAGPLGGIPDVDELQIALGLMVSAQVVKLNGELRAAVLFRFMKEGREFYQPILLALPEEHMASLESTIAKTMEAARAAAPSAKNTDTPP